MATGFLYRIHHGVYAVGRPQLSFEGYCRAATLACGPGSAISHISAARLWGIRQSTGAIHVSIPRQRKGHPGLHIHRPRSLPFDDLATTFGFSVTTVARTLLDMTPGRAVDDVARWIHEAGVMRVLDCRDVWAVLTRHQHHRGGSVLEAALGAEVALTRTGLERAFLVISRRARMPKPRVNAWVWSGEKPEEADFYWPQLGLIVEVDGGAYHWSRWRRRRDAEKDARFRAAGRTVWRIPELEITFNPRAVVAELRRLTATLGRSNRPLMSVRSPGLPS